MAQPTPGELERERAFISEVFHDLSQPLTALHVSLDLSLHRDRTIEELRGSLESALQNTERLRQRLLLVRALQDAADAVDQSQLTDLSGRLRELHEYLLPMFESAGQDFILTADHDPLFVHADSDKLRRAFIYFLEYIFRYSCRGAALRVRVEGVDQLQAEVSITTASCLPVGPDTGRLHYASEIEIMVRTFRGAGGRFALQSSANDRNVWRGSLRLAEG